MALLERDAELAALQVSIERLARSLEGGVVLIEGVAGIGKSSLLGELVERARRQEGLRVLTARGTELELGLAFGAVRQLFAPIVALPEEVRAPLFAGPAALAAAVLGVRERPQDDLADPLYALSWLVTNLAEGSPLVIALDDVHWLDDESARFAVYLAQRIQGLPVLLVGSARPREPGAMTGPLDTLRELSQVVRPSPLSESASAAVIGGDADRAEVHRLTGGNPFLLAELGRALEGAGPGATLDEVQTRAVAQSVARRVLRVGPDAVALADAVALFAAGAELAVAAEVAGLSSGAAGAAADALIAADVLSADGTRLEFLHPLMRAALYEELGPFARLQGHAAAARALKARPAPAEHVAAHLLAGEPEQDPENLRILRAAADQAMAAVAPRAAARYLERAAAEGAAEPAEQRELLIELGRLQRMTGAPEARATLERALELSRGTPQHVQAAIELAATGFAQADHGVVVRTVRSMEGVDATADERLILEMLHAESLWSAMQLEESVRLIERVPRDLPGDTPAQRMALGMAGAVYLMRGEPTDAVMDVLRRSVGEDGSAPAAVAGIDVGDPLQWMIMAERLDEAQALAEERMEHARATGDEALFAATQNSYGWVLDLRGDLAGSIAAFRLGLASPALAPWMRAHIAVNLVQTLIHLGDLDAADAELDRLGETTFAHGVVMVELRHAQIACWRGEFAAAVDTFAQDYETNTRLGEHVHPNSLFAVPDYVDTLIGLGRAEEAVPIARGLLERSDRYGAVFGTGIYSGGLGRATGDEGLLRRAVEVLAASPYRWHEARARLDLGAHLRRAGRRAEAREHLRAALDYFDANGVRHLAGRAREELKVSGAKLRAEVHHSGVSALTPSELRIARLAADGMSNKEIAQHLFVTVGTVQTTLVHVYRKLGIGGRREIADAIGAEIPMAP